MSLEIGINLDFRRQEKQSCECQKDTKRHWYQDNALKMAKSTNNSAYIHESPEPRTAIHINPFIRAWTCIKSHRSHIGIGRFMGPINPRVVVYHCVSHLQIVLSLSVTEWYKYLV